MLGAPRHANDEILPSNLNSHHFRLAQWMGMNFGAPRSLRRRTAGRAQRRRPVPISLICSLPKELASSGMSTSVAWQRKRSEPPDLRLSDTQNASSAPGPTVRPGAARRRRTAPVRPGDPTGADAMPGRAEASGEPNHVGTSDHNHPVAPEGVLRRSRSRSSTASRGSQLPVARSTCTPP